MANRINCVIVATVFGLLLVPALVAQDCHYGWAWVPSCNNQCWCDLDGGGACDWVPVMACTRPGSSPNQPIPPGQPPDQPPVSPPSGADSETSCGPGGHCAGEPINLATGNSYVTQNDVRLPGLGGGLALTRTWNSAWPTTQNDAKNGLFGSNWRSTYEERVTRNISDNTFKWARADGSFWSFGYVDYATNDWQLVAPVNGRVTLTLGTSDMTVNFINGEKHKFDNTLGYLTQIIDRNGNTTTLSYDAANRLTIVADPASRHLYFNYADSSSYLVTSVTSDFGVSLTYTYDGQGRLFKVTKPDLSIITFEYDASSRITAVKDSNGKVIESHTYDNSGRGLTSSRAGGVEALSVVYPQ